MQINALFICSNHQDQTLSDPKGAKLLQLLKRGLTIFSRNYRLYGSIYQMSAAAKLDKELQFVYILHIFSSNFSPLADSNILKEHKTMS